MPSQITNYQCPACSGPIHFVGESGKLECDYCGSKYEVEEIEKYYAAKEQKAEKAFADAELKRQEAMSLEGGPVAPGGDSGMAVAESSNDWGAGASGMKTYNCPSCRAELICDSTTAATSCPYCGNPSIVPGQFGGAQKPDYIIPFKLDKDAAVAALKNYYSWWRKILLPSAFVSENHIEEMQGLYVPFWLYDLTVDADCIFDATYSVTREEGNNRIVTTNYFKVHRAGTVSFEHIPADGSKKMRDDYMDSIEPFDYTGLKPFSTAYLPGYLADKYDDNAEQCVPRIDKRCRNSAIEVMKNDARRNGGHLFESVSETDYCKTDIHFEKVDYALFPVWTLLTKWGNEEYVFMMNGQTGKLVGELPVSEGKFGTLFVILTTVFAVITSLFDVGLWPSLLVGGVLSLIFSLIIRSSMTNVSQAEVAGDYILEEKNNITLRDEKFSHFLQNEFPIKSN